MPTPILRSTLLLLLAAGCQSPQVVENDGTTGDGTGDGSTTDDTGTTVAPITPVIHLDPAEPYTDDDITVIVDSPADASAGFTYAWSRNGEAWSGDLATIPASQTTRGDLWSVEVRLLDAEAGGGAGKASAVVANTPPVVSSLRITPSSPETSDTLVVAFDATDRDDDVIDTSIRWYLDGVSVSDLIDELEVPSSWLAPQQEWTVEVLPTDGDDEGELASTSVIVDNRAPSLASVSLSPTDPRVADSVVGTAAGGSDPDGQAVSVIFSWYVGGSMVSETTSATGTDSLSGLFVKGDSIYVVATPTDGQDSGEPVTSASIVVENSPPSIAAVTLDPATGDESTTFTCLAGPTSDDDGDTVSEIYAWTVNGTTISATSSTLTGTSFKKNQDLVCAITPNDGTDSGSPVSSNTVTISNSPPTMTGVTLTSSPTESTGVQATPVGGTDADGDSISYAYAWYVGGTLASSTSSKLTGSYFVRGDSVYVEVTPKDSTSSGTMVTSSSVTIENATPSISSVSLSPSSVYTDDTLTCTPNGWSDADGDSASYTYEWTLNSATLSGAASSSLDGTTDFDRGDKISCTVTPDDGIDSGTSRSSSTTTIKNTTPVASAVITSGATAVACDEIDLDASGSSDDDDDSLSYTWTLQSAPSSSFSTSSDIMEASDEAPIFVVDATGTFTFKLSTSDGSASNTDTDSVLVSARPTNTDPVADAGGDQSGSGYATCSWTGSTWSCAKCAGDTFTIDGGGSTDDDGDPLHYRWTTSSSYTTITSSSSESTTVKLANLPATYGASTTYTSTLHLFAVDCAGGYSEDEVDLVFTCTGI